MFEILKEKVFGVDKCEVLGSAPMASIAKSAVVKCGEYEGQPTVQIVMTLIDGGMLSANAKGGLKDLTDGAEVPVATATVDLVVNTETGRKSYRAHN